MKQPLFRLAAATLMLLTALLPMAQRPGTFSILGDSYSTFEGHVTPDWNAIWYFAQPDTTRTDVSDPSQTWWSIYAAQNGLEMERNNSFSGSTISTHGYRHGDYADRSFVSRMYNLGDPETILIFGGTNDSWAGAPAGDWVWENQTVQDLKSFRPSLARLLSGIKTLYPKAKVVFMLNNELRDEINSSVLEACARYGIPVLKLEGISKMANHPDRKGMQQIADQLTDFMSR